MSTVKEALGGSTFKMSEYYGKSFTVPSSGPIKFSHFYRDLPQSSDLARGILANTYSGSGTLKAIKGTTDFTPGSTLTFNSAFPESLQFSHSGTPFTAPVPHLASTESASFTIFIAFTRTAGSGIANARILAPVKADGTTSNASNFEVALTGGLSVALSGLSLYFPKGSSAGGGWVARTASYIDTNKWQLFVCRYNVATQTLDTFVNGVKDTITGVPPGDPGSLAGYLVMSGVVTGSYVPAAVAGVLHYNTALSDASIDSVSTELANATNIYFEDPSMAVRFGKSSTPTIAAGKSSNGTTLPLYTQGTSSMINTAGRGWVLKCTGTGALRSTYMLGGGSYTKAAWIYRVSTGEGGILGNQNNSTDYDIFRVSSTGTLEAGHNTASLAITSSFICQTTNILDTATWTHVAVTWDNDTRTGIIYVNGDPWATNTLAVADSRVKTYSTGPMYIGLCNNKYFPGYIDDVFVIDRVMTQKEIKLLMNTQGATAASPMPALISAYYTDTYTSGSWVDQAVQNTLTVGTGVTYVASSGGDNIARFALAGTGSYFGSSGLRDMFLTLNPRAYTFAIVIRPAASQGGTGYNRILGHVPNYTNGPEWLVDTQNQFWVYGLTSTTPPAALFTIPTTGWTCIIGSYYADTNVVKVYRNGTLHTSAVPITLPSGAGLTGLKICSTPSFTDLFAGDIAVFVVYEGLLDDTQASTLSGQIQSRLGVTFVQA